MSTTPTAPAVAEETNSVTIDIPRPNGRRTFTEREKAPVQAKPVAEPPAAEPEPPPAASVTATEPEAVKSPEPATPEQPEPKKEESKPVRDIRVKATPEPEATPAPGDPKPASSRDPRIDLFYKQQEQFRKTEADMAALRDELARIKNGGTPAQPVAASSPAPVVAAPSTDGRPKWDPEKYAAKGEINGLSGYDLYVDELTDWKTEQNTKKLEEKLETKARHERAAADANLKMSAWQRKVQSAAIPDYDAVISASSASWKSVAEGQEINQAIIEMDHGPEVAYHLATNPDELARIDSLPTKTKKLAALNALDEQYSKPVQVQDNQAATPVHNALPTGVSHAPEPVRPLRPTSHNPVLDPNKIVGSSQENSDFRKFADAAGIVVQQGRWGKLRN